MSSFHFLNVKAGDCTIIRHGSGHWSMIDICYGNSTQAVVKEARDAGFPTKPRGNFRMCSHPTSPLDYLSLLGVDSIFRFILTHPDMDHMDGIDALFSKISVNNYWDSGVRKAKPDFKGSPYKEADWDRYVKVRDGKEEGVTVVSPRAGSRFQYANQNADGESGGDGLYILSPSKGLVDEANKSGDVNDASYVLLYRSMGGKILIPGDAHDKTWEYVLENHEDDVKDCTLMVAPHHGRKTGRSYEFLDVVKPKLTLFGCAGSEHLAYDAWNNRELVYFTNNQVGCVSAEMGGGNMDVYIENKTFAEKLRPGRVLTTNSQGFYLVLAL